MAKDFSFSASTATFMVDSSMMQAKVLGPIGMKAIEKRGLDPEICARLEVHTARSENGEVIADPNGNIIVFPYIEHGVTVAEKYRAAGKRFWQKAGGRRTFYNSDVLDDPALENGSAALIITEGEPDTLAALSCGFPFSVSVPDGAPPAVESTSPDKLDPAAESTGKYEFLWVNRDRLKRIKRFIIAVDNDAPGQRLAAELVRRLGASRCLFVTYPEGCKDLNDVLMLHGAEAVSAVLNGAQHYPVKGVYTLSDYPDRPAIETYLTGWQTVDELYRVFAPSFTVITGLPGSGKSSWLTHLLVNLAETHGWKSAVFSPEMPVVPHLRDKVRRIVGRSAIDRMGGDRLANVDRWIGQNFIFIDHDTSGDDEDITLEWLMERAADAVLRYGIRILVIDPWNEVEHAKDQRESMTDYVNRSLRQLKKFGQRYSLAIFVIAHPTKDVAKDGKSRVPTLYDIADSSAFFNKPDIGIVIDRPDAHSDETMIYVKKVRFEGTGNKGAVKMRFDRETSRYELLNPVEQDLLTA
jgi:twinkle protein